MKKNKQLLTILIFFVGILMPMFNHRFVTAQEEVSVAIVQLVSHPSLDKIVSGIYQGLAEEGYLEGENLKVDYQNAENDLNLLATISQQVVSQNPDIIFAVTTPVAQSLQNATTEIPIVLTGITDPVKSNLVNSLDQPGGNITGVSDKVSHESQFDLIKQIMPDIGKIGILYTTSEDNSEHEMLEAKAVAESYGLQVNMQGISSTLDLQMVAENLANQVDAIYIGSDNTIASAFDNLLNITDQVGIPVFTTVDNFVAQGALSAIAIDQKDIGLLAAQEAVKIIKGADVSTQPIVFIDYLRPLFNFEVAERLGIEVSEGTVRDLIDINQYLSEE